MAKADIAVSSDKVRGRRMSKGLFITFEGPEGCGKSTQSKLLYDRLRKASFRCVHTREPGGTKLGERIRELLLHSGGIAISDMSELYLFEAARAQIVRQVIAPALAKKAIVICDRFSDATFSYQGYGGKISLDTIAKLDAIAAAGLKPDLTILLDVDTMTGLRRARRKGIDRMERKDLTYHRRVRAGYLERAGQDPRRIKVMSAKGSIEEIREAVWHEVEDVVRRYSRPG